MTWPVQGILLHFGRRPDASAPRLARVASGAVVTRNSAPDLHRELLKDGLPTLMQDDGLDAEGAQASLLSPEEHWFLAQQRQTSAFTSPIIYVGSREENSSKAMESLRAAGTRIREFQRIVRDVDRHAPVLALFAVHHHWLSRDAARLISVLRDIGMPVGLMTWHSRDPFESPKAIEGMLEVIRAVDEVAVLRSDLAAIGFRAHGAVMASIGIGTGTRHFSRDGLRGFADTDDQSPRALVGPLLAYWKGSRIAHAGDDPLLVCPCPVCDGLPLARFIDPTYRPQAAEHSVHVWSELAAQLEDVSVSQRPEWWSSRVSGALLRIQELEDRIYLPEAPPRQLEAWSNVLGAKVR